VSLLTDVTDATFATDVLEASVPVVVDFWAPSCGPCHKIRPFLEELAGEPSGIAFVKLDIDVNPVVPARYGVLSIPTVMVFVNGEPRGTVVGAKPRKHFEDLVAPHRT